jgi:hypothetical protein
MTLMSFAAIHHRAIAPNSSSISCSTCMTEKINVPHPAGAVADKTR